MKKIIASIAAAVLLGSLAGCGSGNTHPDENTDTAFTAQTSGAAAESEAVSDTQATAESGTVPDVQAAVESETISDTQAAVESETFSDTQASADTQAKPGDTDSISSDGSLTEKTMKKIEEWSSGNVIIEMSMYEDGVSVHITSNKYGSKGLIDMDAAGLFQSRFITDGSVSYIISDKNRVYCKTDEDEPEGEDMLEDVLMDSRKAADVKASGRETVDGVEYSFEEFKDDGDIMRYYFDDKGNICYIGVYDDGELQTVNFRATFLDAPDESVFSIPAGYTEVSEKDMGMLIIADMFGGISDLDDLDDFDDFLDADD